MDATLRFYLEASSSVNNVGNAFNRKFNKIMKPYDYISQLNLNMQKEHFTKHGMHINGRGKYRIYGFLTTRITELLTTHHLGTLTALPWKTETTEEEEEKMRSVVEELNFTSPELIVTDEQGKHSTSVKQDGVKVQNVDFVPVHNAQHGTLHKLSNSSDKLCTDSDNSTQPLQIT